MSKPRVVCVIQARTTSTRLPNKIFKDLAGKPVLARVIDRVQAAQRIDQVVIAAPDNESNDSIETFVKETYPGVGLYRGSEDDVLDRYYQAASTFKADVVVRATSDCPLLDPGVIGKVVTEFLSAGVDYGANVLGERTYPRGLDIEVFTFDILKRMWDHATEPDDREHVTLHLRKAPEGFSTINVIGNRDLSKYRLTVDTQNDYDLIQWIFESLPEGKRDFESVIALLEANPDKAMSNQHIKQKYGQY